MFPENEIRVELKRRGADFVHFVDVSDLSTIKNHGINTAILFGMALSPEFIEEVASNENYVRDLVLANRHDDDEFSQKELEVGQIADELAAFLQSKGYLAYSQSDKNLTETGCYNTELHTTLLPHKTIALLAGLGWIGKHDLLITPEFGSAISMCTVLTNAPLPIQNKAIILPKCGNCTICMDVCPTDALTGKIWDKTTTRDEILNVYACTTCLKCLVHCPWTMTYARKYFASNSLF
jgi:epoxyqueuosine reductase QueG